MHNLPQSLLNFHHECCSCRSQGKKGQDRVLCGMSQACSSIPLPSFLLIGALSEDLSCEQTIICRDSLGAWAHHIWLLFEQEMRQKLSMFILVRTIYSSRHRIAAMFFTSRKRGLGALCPNGDSFCSSITTHSLTNVIRSLSSNSTPVCSDSSPRDSYSSFWCRKHASDPKPNASVSEMTRRIRHLEVSLTFIQKMARYIDVSSVRMHYDLFTPYIPISHTPCYLVVIKPLAIKHSMKILVQNMIDQSLP